MSSGSWKCAFLEFNLRRSCIIYTGKQIKHFTPHHYIHYNTIRVLFSYKHNNSDFLVFQVPSRGNCMGLVHCNFTSHWLPFWNPWEDCISTYYIGSNAFLVILVILVIHCEIFFNYGKDCCVCNVSDVRRAKTSFQ